MEPQTPTEYERTELPNPFTQNWYTLLGQSNTVFGTLTTVGDLSSSSFRHTDGTLNGSSLSPKDYSSGRNGVSQAGINLYSVSKTGKSVGYLLTATEGVYNSIKMDTK